MSQKGSDLVTLGMWKIDIGQSDADCYWYANMNIRITIALKTV